MEEVLADNGLKEFVESDIQKLVAVDIHNLSEWKKCVARERRIILEGVQDHIVSNIYGKYTVYAR